MSLRVKFIRFLISLNENIFFYPNLKRAYKKLLIPKNLILIDVGSNRGQSIDFYIKNFSVKRTTGFEPNKKLFNSLIKKYKNYQSIEIFNLGVSSKSDNIMFHENILDETSTFENINQNSKYANRKARILGINPEELFKEKYYVECLTLNQFLTTNKISKVDILKVDVEGHEYEVLKGLFSIDMVTKINFIQLESHNDDMYSNKTKEIHEILLSNNFNLRKSINHGFGDFKVLIYVNQFFKSEQ